MSYANPGMQREYQKKWMVARRNSWIEQNGPCVSCGSSDQLEVDHIDRSLKAMEPSQIWSRRKEVRDAELTKCQVLCRPCHKRKTITESIPEHGTNSRYTGRGCRCTACRAAHAVVARAYRTREI